MPIEITIAADGVEETRFVPESTNSRLKKQLARPKEVWWAVNGRGEMVRMEARNRWEAALQLKEEGGRHD